MGNLDRTAQEDIRQRVRGLRGSELSKEAAKVAQAHGVSLGTVYRYSTEVREAARRSNKGEIRLPVQEKVLAEMKAFTFRTDAAATDVVRIFENNGHLDPGLVSPAWFSRWLRRNGFSRKQMKIDSRPCRRFEASEPGEVYQVDGTTAEQFYIDDDGSVGWESTVSRNKNRPGNQKRRLEIIACIDDQSRCRYAEFTNGKTVHHWMNVLFNAFKTKDDPRFRFHGIPRAIYMDNDSIAKTNKFKLAMKALGIEIKKHKPTKKGDRFSNARSKGKIERTLQIFAEKQKITKLQKLPSLEVANQFLFEVCLELNSKEHSTTGEMPFQRWNRIRPEMLVECDDDTLYDTLYRDIFERKVYRDLTVRFDGQVWQLDYAEPFLSMINQAVSIYRHPLRKDEISIEWEGREHLVARKEMDVRSWAEGPAHIPLTAREIELRKLEATDLSHLKLWGFDQGVPEGVAFLPKTGTPLDTSRIKPEPPRVPRVDAMKKIRIKFGQEQLSPEQNLYLRSVFGPQVTEEEIALALEELTRPAVREVKAG